MRKTHCFYPPFASSLSQTPALKAVVASTILNNIQSEKARLRSARSVSPASLHCGRPYSADRGRHGSGEKSSQNSISRSHPFPQKGSKRYSESYFTPQTGPKPPMRFSPACGPCFRTEKTRKLIIWSGRRHVRTPSTEILLFSRHQEKEKKRYIEAVTPLLPGKPSYHIGWLRICDEARAKPATKRSRQLYTFVTKEVQPFVQASHEVQIPMAPDTPEFWPQLAEGAQWEIISTGPGNQLRATLKVPDAADGEPFTQQCWLCHHCARRPPLLQDRRDPSAPPDEKAVLSEHFLRILGQRVQQSRCHRPCHPYQSGPNLGQTVRPPR